MSIGLAGRALGAVLLATLALVVTAAPAGASSRTETRNGYASVGLWGTDAYTGVTAHSEVKAFDPPDSAPFALGDVFVSNGYECLPDSRVRAGIDRLTSAWARGQLSLTCIHPTLPERTGHAVVRLQWQAKGPVTRYSWSEGACTTTLRLRHADVSGAVRLVVPGVVVATLRPEDHPGDSVRQERTVCR